MAADGSRPDSILRLRPLYWLGYIAIYSLLLWLLWNVHASPFANDELPTVVVLTFFNALFFFLVQASNPGYLSTELVEKMGLLPSSSSSSSSATDVEMSPPSRAVHGGGDAMFSSISTEEDEQASKEDDKLSGGDDWVGGGAPVPILADEGEERDGSGEAEEDAAEAIEHGDAKGEEFEDVGFTRTVDELEFGSAAERYCEECDMAQPLRAHHCRYCNRCVAMFDHHCFAIGTCIGERNHCRFWWMLFSHVITLLFVIDRLWFTYQRTTSWSAWLNTNALSLAAHALFLPIAIFLIALWGIHTFFAATNSTTYEMAKFDTLPYLAHTQLMDLPFSRGLITNVNLFCCLRDASCAYLQPAWRPQRWQAPGRILRDEEDWWEHPWENKYWTCC